jgi:hypothetical protein
MALDQNEGGLKSTSEHQRVGLTKQVYEFTP